MKRLPDYLKRQIIDTENTKNVRAVLKHNCLNTVCENARCPNKNECYQKNTATFLIMGNVCTRNCRYCNIGCERPKPLDKDEPKHIAKAVSELGLTYSVITSVTRDDLPDGGAEHFAQTINEIRKISPDTKIEILTPDFKGEKKALDTIKQQLEDMKNGNFTDKDIKDSKELIIASIEGISEEQDTEITYYYGQELANRFVDLKEYMDKIKAVTKDQIVKLAQNININTIYFLKD